MRNYSRLGKDESRYSMLYDLITRDGVIDVLDTCSAVLLGLAHRQALTNVAISQGLSKKSLRISELADSFRSDDNGEE